MPAVGDLLRLRRALTNRLTEGVRAVSAHHLDLRMRAQPRDDLFRLDGGQQIQDTSRRQIDDDGPEPAATAKGELVDPNRGADDRLCDTPSARKSRLPAAPPNAKPTAVNQAVRRMVRRAEGATTSGSRSVKIWRSHEGAAQKKRRTVNSNRTLTPLHGRSSTRRW
jgi:hypothetical protein